MSKAAYKAIKQTNALPSPTGVALEILRLANDESTTIEQLTATVETDPAISSRLLRLVNSPLAGLARRVSSISGAIKLLGIRTVKNLALGFSLVADNREGACAGFDYDTFWSDSLGRAVAARVIAHRTKGFPPDEAFAAGLLSQIGRLALATVFPETYAYALNLAQEGDVAQLLKTEREVLEIDHNELAAEMFADWYLPESFQVAVRAQDGGEVEPAADSPGGRLTRILHLAGSVAAVLADPVVYREALAAMVNEAHRLGIRPDILPADFDLIGTEWRETGTVFSVPARRVPPLAEIYAQARRARGSLDPASTEASAGVRW